MTPGVALNIEIIMGKSTSLPVCVLYTAAHCPDTHAVLMTNLPTVDSVRKMEITSTKEYSSCFFLVTRDHVSDVFTPELVGVRHSFQFSQAIALYKGLLINNKLMAIFHITFAVHYMEMCIIIILCTLGLTMSFYLCRKMVTRLLEKLILVFTALNSCRHILLGHLMSHEFDIKFSAGMYQAIMLKIQRTLMNIPRSGHCCRNLQQFANHL